MLWKCFLTFCVDSWQFACTALMHAIAPSLHTLCTSHWSTLALTKPLQKCQWHPWRNCFFSCFAFTLHAVESHAERSNENVCRHCGLPYMSVPLAFQLILVLSTIVCLVVKYAQRLTNKGWPWFNSTVWDPGMYPALANQTILSAEINDSMGELLLLFEKSLLNMTVTGAFNESKILSPSTATFFLIWELSSRLWPGSHDSGMQLLQ